MGFIVISDHTVQDYEEAEEGNGEPDLEREADGLPYFETAILPQHDEQLREHAGPALGRRAGVIDNERLSLEGLRVHATLIGLFLN